MNSINKYFFKLKYCISQNHLSFKFYDKFYIFLLLNLYINTKQDFNLLLILNIM